MENENEICGVCSFPYDSIEHTPRVLVNCGHTLCSFCLMKIIKDSKLRKCPFDNHSFKRTQKCLENFPTNFALLAVLEGRSQHDICKIHQKKMTLLCLQDNVKICSECDVIGEHKGHRTKKIEDLKAKGLKAKKDIEESLVKFEKNNQDVETSKKRCLGQIGQKFGEITKILKDKRKQVQNFFEKNITNQNGLSLKQEASKTIEEINQAFKTEENLALLDRDFSSIMSKLQLQVSKGSDETSGMMDRLDSFLTNQIKWLNSFDLPNDERKLEQSIVKEKEKQQHLASNGFEKKNAQLTLEISEGFVLLSMKIPNPFHKVIHLGSLYKMKKLKVELQQYDSLSQGSTDLKYLSEILQQLNNYTSLIVSFAPEGLTDIHALHLLNFLFCRIQDLTEIDISFERCKITNEPILFFFNNVLPKATSLKYLTLKLGFTALNEKSLFALAQSLSGLNENLKTLTLRAEQTAITDEGIEKVLYVIKGIKGLCLYLEETEITDRSLKVLGNKVMHQMKNLEQFSLDVNKTKITMEGVKSIFTGLPKEIRGLSLSFEGIEMSDEVVSLFEEIVCPKLKVVEDVHLRLEGKDLRDRASKLLDRVRKDAAERIKVIELLQRKNNH